MKIIDSRQNAQIKAIVSLHQRKNRLAHKRYIAEGKRVCTSLIQSQQQLEHLYVTSAELSQAQDLVDESRIILVKDDVMEKISPSKSPSGILGIFKQPDVKKNLALTSGVVLAHLADPGNMGSLIRSCAAMGHKTVVVIEGADPYSPKVVQASAGTLGMVNIVFMSWPELLAAKQKIKLCALIVNGGNKPSELDLTSTLLVVGNEAHGLPKDWVKDCEYALTLPMPGHAESLNAAIAGSIALYFSAQIQ